MKPVTLQSALIFEENLKSTTTAPLSSSSLNAKDPRWIRPVAYFPSAFEEETVYSIFARASVLTGDRTGNALLDEFLLEEKCAGHVAVPSTLDLLENVSGICATEETLRSRSLLGAFLPLLPSAKRLSLAALCRRYGQAPAVRGLLGLNRYPACGRMLKFCPGCVQDQKEAMGMSFWTTRFQTPGSWICRRHEEVICFSPIKRRRNAWLLPTHFVDHGVQALRGSYKLPVRRRMVRLQEVMAWLADHTALNHVALASMIRHRFRLAGLCRSEFNWDVFEIDHLDVRVRKHYSTMSVPDVQECNASNWLPSVLSGDNIYHPLPWALALAWVGDTDTVSLEQAYFEALERNPQDDLFKAMLRDAHRPHAPAKLYQACRKALSWTDVQDRTGMRLSDIDRWLQKDPMLREEWDAAIRIRRHNDSVEEIRQFLNTQPNATRMDVLQACSSSYRWLQSNDSSSLRRLLPRPDALGGQLKFEW